MMRTLIIEVEETIFVTHLIINVQLYPDFWFLKCYHIWQNFYFYRILNDEYFTTEVEETIFVAHLIIKVQLYLDFWKPGWKKYQLILLLGNLKQQNSFKGRLKDFIWRRAVS